MKFRALKSAEISLKHFEKRNSNKVKKKLDKIALKKVSAETQVFG